MEQYKCPRCIDETLVRVAGNLLVCQSCEVTFVDRENVNNIVGTVELLPEVGNGTN